MVKPMPVDISKATLDDALTISVLNADVQAIHAAALPWRFKEPGLGTFDTAAAQDLLSKPNHFGFVAHASGKPAGYLVAEIVHYPDTPRHHAHDMIYVHHISVRPDARRRGVGSALLNAAKGRGKTLGITLLALDVWTFNDDARAFFRRYGLVSYNEKMWTQIE
jgi:ribosomal protein S18 acetylase RimI-like enzyme